MRRSAAAGHDLEQSVAGSDEPAAVDLDRHRPVQARADPRIDDAQEHRTPRKIPHIGGQEISARARIMSRRIGQQGHHRHRGGLPVQHRAHLAQVGATGAKIGEQDDHGKDCAVSGSVDDT
jgi:hypothetical protein